MKTPAEIKARIEAEKDRDWLGTIRSDLVSYLPFEDAHEYLKPEAQKEEWDARKISSPLDSARDYLSFAWEKANDCRGISAGRSLDHLSAWLWLAGYGDVVDAHFHEYELYGKQQLVIASILSGFDWKSHDNGRWVNDESGPPIPVSKIFDLVTEAQKIATDAMQGATR